MKTRFPTPQIFHLWANRTHAHRIKGGNVHADGALLFSYAECIGILRDGLPAIVSSYKWSNTTTDHQYRARAALNHNPVMLPCHFPRDGSLPRLAQMAREQATRTLRNIDHGNKARLINKAIASEYADYCALLNFAATVDGLPPAAIVDTLQDLRALRDGQLIQDHKTRLDNRAGALKLSVDAARNIVKGESWHGLDHALEQMNLICERVPDLQADYVKEQMSPPDYLGKLRAQAKKLLPKLEIMRDARDAERVRINADKIARWHAGEDVYLPRELPPMLRITGEHIVTSKGASVPVAVAPMLWELVNAVRAAGVDVDYNLTVGDYTLNLALADGSIVVGCHNIAFSELELIAKQLKFI